MMLIGFDQEMRGSTDDIAKIDEGLNQDRDRIGFGMRINRSHYIARESVKGRLIYRRPCDKSDISDKRFPTRQPLDQRRELVRRTASSKPIANITFRRASRPMLGNIENTGP